MTISLQVRRQAFEKLVHHYPVKTLARELGLSSSAVATWSIFLRHGNFEWLRKEYIPQPQDLLRKATVYWFDHFPVCYAAVARNFGLRPSGLYKAVRLALSRLPDNLHPEKTLFWAALQEAEMDEEEFDVDSLPKDRPLNAEEFRRLRRAMELARTRLGCSEAILEEAAAGCTDEFKKKEIQRQLKLTRKALKSKIYAP